MCEAFPARFGVGSSCKSRPSRVRRQRSPRQPTADTFAVIPWFQQENCECWLLQALVAAFPNVDACKPHADLAFPSCARSSRLFPGIQGQPTPLASNAATPFCTNGRAFTPPLVSVAGRLSALTQAVSYHVTPRAGLQPLGNRGNAALGSYVLLLCLVCGVKKIGSLMACQRHRCVA